MRTALISLLLPIVSTAQVPLSLIAHRPVEPNLFGLNSILGTIYVIPFDDPVLNDVIKTLRVGGWRYPGGTVANYYDISQGNYLRSCNASNCSCCENRDEISKLVPPDSLSGASFMRSGAVGSSLQARGPIWDLNVFLMSAEAAADQVDYLNASVGREQVQFLEMGNEFYLDAYRWRFPTAASYIANANMTIERAQSTFPDARVAVVADQIWHGDKGCNGGWNEALAAAMPPSVRDVTMHDYSLSNATVQYVSGDWQKLSFTLAYSDAVMQNAAQGAKACFGDDVSIWQTEYNYAAGTGGGFDHKHGPLFGHMLNGTIHGAYLASRMLHAVANPTYKAVDFMCALAVDGIGWGKHSGIVELDVDFNATPTPRVRSARVTGMAQIYAHLSFLAAHTEGTTTMAGLVQSRPSPSLNVTVAGTSNLPCLQGAAFFGNAASPGGLPSSYGIALINRCPDAVSAVLPSPATTEGVSEAAYSGTIALYDAKDPGGSAPLPSASEPHPWAGGPLNMTRTVVLSGQLPLTLKIPGLTMAMGKMLVAGTD